MKRKADRYPPGENGNWATKDDQTNLLQTDEKEKRGASVWVWNEEGKNVALLFCLYLLQGIPLGLIASIPLMLQNMHASYKVCNRINNPPYGFFNFLSNLNITATSRIQFGVLAIFLEIGVGTDCGFLVFLVDWKEKIMGKA